MTRTLLALLSLAAFALPTRAADFPLGKTVQVELVKSGAAPYASQYGYSVTLPIEQGDKFRFEGAPVGGAAMRLLLDVYTANDKSFESSDSGEKIDWQMTKGAPGKLVKVYVTSPVPGKVNLRITKVGDADAADANGDELKKLRAQNADLKKQLAETKKQLDDQKRQLDTIIELLKKKM